MNLNLYNNMKLYDYLCLLRIRNWLGYFLIATLGFLLSKGFMYSPSEIFIFYLLIFLYLGFSFSINDCFDIEEDKFNKLKRNPIVEGKLKFKNALIFSFLLIIFGIILSLTLRFKAFLFYILISFISFSYSSPPLRLKSRFLMDLISHGLFFGAFLFLFPFFIFDQLILFHYLIAISLFCFSIIQELRNHIEDYESDKKAGLKTTVCVLGLEKSKKLVDLLIILFSIILFSIFFFVQINFFIILTLIFYLIYTIKKNYRILDIYVGISYGLLVAVLTL